MSRQVTLFLFVAILLQIVSGCSTKWSQAIQSGDITQNQFTETIKIDVTKKLIFVPVTIKGKTYNFLFDTGAPLSISNKLQSTYNFKVVSKGNIRDSDNNRKQVRWIGIDTIGIGKVLFTDQTAFVGDFEANPILKCLEIDGIIGSNLMRHCNWTIDQKLNTLTISRGTKENKIDDHITIPFKTDDQYNIFVDIKIGRSTIKNVLVDYGSNGSIALSKEVFSKLQSANTINHTFHEIGEKQSGIIGKAVRMNREITCSDSIYLESMHLKKVKIKTGKTVSIGNSLLSRFNVTIDWNDKYLHLHKASEDPDAASYSGFSLGYSAERGIYVRSVIEKSNADQAGTKTQMKVLKMDDLDFEGSHDYCDYVYYEPGQNITLEVLDDNDQTKVFQFEKMILR